MEEAWQIVDYLPRSFKAEKDQEYINFLWGTFTGTYEHGKYQFAFLAFHMLTIFRFLKLIDCDNSKIGNYVKLVTAEIPGVE